MSQVVRFVVLVVLITAPVHVLAEAGGRSLEAMASKDIDTPKEHREAASLFRAKAREARSEAKLHERMASNYSRRSTLGGAKSMGGTKARAASEMKAHCDAIASEQARISDQYEALAILHEAEAEDEEATTP